MEMTTEESMTDSPGVGFVRFQPELTDWAALRTSARWEKTIAEKLAVLGVPVFLPLMTRVTQYARSRRFVEVPVFGGYVFCSPRHYLDNKQVPPSVRSKVAQILRPSDPEQLWKELCTIANVVQDRRLIQERSVAKLGDVVRITRGPLQGSEGTVIHSKPNLYKLVLEISFLGARIEAEVEEFAVTKV